MRAKTVKLMQLEILNRRTMLSDEDRKDFNKCRMGHVGELQFDSVIEMLACPVVHLKDYRFQLDDSAGRDKKVGNGPSEVQIDNIIITDDQLYTFEIKNYQYDMEYYADRPWRFAGGREIVNPMNQVDSHRNVLTSLMKDFNMQFNLSANLVFIHPEQTIYNLPNHPNIYTRSNLNKRLKYLLKPNRYDYSRFVEMLDTRRIFKSAYDSDANVTFEELAGGVFCADCANSSLRRMHRDKFVCDECGDVMTKPEVVQQLIRELHILNSTWQVNSEMIAKYSGNQFSGSTIRRYRLKGYIDF